MRIVLGASLCALALLACSDNDPSLPIPTPTATPTGSTAPGFMTPPSAYLTDRTGSPVEGATGTYCWQLGQRGVCADYSPWVTNTKPIPVDAGTPLGLTFDAGTPRDTRIRWLLTTGMAPRNHGDTLDWTPSDYTPPQPSADLRAPTVPGRYALAVLTYFPEGDVTYGFYVEVR